MEILKGIPVSPGIAINEALIVDTEEYQIPQRFIWEQDSDEEIARFHDANEKAKAEITALRDRISNDKDLGPSYGQIFDFHGAILSDTDHYLKPVEARIGKNRFSAEYAVSRTLHKYAKLLDALEDEYFRARVADIVDVEKRVMRLLLGDRKKELSNLSRNVVVIAHDLTPSDTAGLDREHVCGFATDLGGRTSHTAIMARALEIPAVVGLETLSADTSRGDTVIIDGTTGLVIIAPDDITLADYKAKQREMRSASESLNEEKDLPSITTDGQKITILSNIEDTEEIQSVFDHGAEGVGLYRTEFLYSTTGHSPTEQEHYDAYSRAVEMLNGAPLVIRTMDMGADKYVKQSGADKEKNPFLGCRSIRLCIERPAMFKTQIRAALRASAKGDVKIMFPLITTLEELHWANGIVEEIKEDFLDEDIDFNEEIKIGIMVETPSVAVSVDLFAPHTDFFSVGTNDLVQFTLAVDRTNERVAKMYQPANPSVLRLLKNTVQAANDENIEVSMCGEMAADSLTLPLLIGLGFRNLSVAPSAVPEMKHIIRNLTIPDCEALAAKVMAMSSEEEINDTLADYIKKVSPNTFVTD